MKKFLQMIAMLVLPVFAIAQNKDLPNPVPNLQLLPAGSYVIAMDNTNQLNKNGDFNLKSYGLIVHLLYKNVNIKWVITAGKAKDGIDFTANAAKIKPVASAAANRDFRAGPFVIFTADTAGVALLIDSFYMNPTGGIPAVALTGNDRPSVYKTMANVNNVDIRYNLAGFKPKAAILMDGGNQKIHTGFMADCSIPDTSWRVNMGQNLISNCFTFASEPHNDKVGTPGFEAAIAGIREFVVYGGNFLAQCAAVESYENHVIYGYLQTKTGLTHVNLHHGNDRYTNNDLSYAQYDGYFHSTQTGHLQSWDINSSWGNNGYMIQNDPHTAGGDDNIGASVSKLIEINTRGGMVFYLGNHDFKNLDHLEDINGIRMYMNAFLTPVDVNMFCTIPPPLPITWYSFTATSSKMNVQLQWKTAVEISNKYFYPERSIDGIHFTALTAMPGAINSNELQTYDYTDMEPGSGVFFYRIRQEDIDGASTYSVIRSVKIDGTSGTEVYIYPNPGTGLFTVNFSQNNVINAVMIFDKTGRRVYGSEGTLANINEMRLDLGHLAPGIYTALFLSGNGSGTITKKIVIAR